VCGRSRLQSDAPTQSCATLGGESFSIIVLDIAQVGFGVADAAYLAKTKGRNTMRTCPTLSPMARRVAEALAIGGSGLFSLSVLAQAPASPAPPVPTTAKIEKIEVTGSLIKRTDAETPSVVQVITAQDIKNSGYATVEELMRSLSSVDASSLQDGAASGFVGGLATISLRGFGSQGTLVLINGRRIAPVAAVDINFGRGSLINVNSIPKDAIERIEILKDGASALYGSDAMAGVVNYVLKKEYRGLEVSGSYGANDERVGKTYSTSLTFGLGDLGTQRFNVFGGIQFSQRDPVMHGELKDRGDLARYNAYLVTNGSLQRFTPDSSASPAANYYRVPTSLAGSTVINGQTVANNNLSGANYLGTFSGCAPENTVGVGVPNRPAGFLSTTASLRNGFCRFNLDEADQAIAEQERTSGSLRATFRLTNELSAYADLMLSKTKTTETGIPRTLTTTLVTSGNPVATTWPRLDGTFLSQNAIILPVGHPDNPTNGTANAQPIQLIYRFTDIPQLDINDLKTLRFTAGLQGYIGAWDIDSALLYSRQDNSRVQTGRLRSSLLTASIASGTYRFTRANDAAAIASVSSDAVNDGESTVTVLDARGSRELFNMAGGAAAMAVGGEVRRETLASVPSDIYRSGDFIGLVANGASGARNSQAAFIEMRLPVIKSLELQGALRQERYSDFGNSTTGKAGFKYDLMPSAVSFRGTAATGFRAPAISQIGDSFVLSFHSTQERRVFDSLRCNSTNPNAPVSLANPSVNRDCNVLGFTAVPAGTVNPGNLPTVVSANRNLKPEESKSFTLGIILSPNKFIDVSIDWWRFRRDDEIRVQRGIDIMDAYNANRAANSALVIRDPNPQSWLPGVPNSGPIVALVRGYGNFKWTETQGYDFDVSLRLPPLPVGNLSLNYSGTVTSYFNQQILDSSPVQQLVGTTTADVPRRKSSVTFRWNQSPWNAWLRYNETSALDRTTTEACLAGATAGNAVLAAAGFCRVGAEKTFDIGGSFSGIKGLTVGVSLLNLTNNYTRSTDVPNTFGYWDNGTTGQLGRRFNVNVSYSFK
jgi:iron complex outermembrane recepter protein